MIPPSREYQVISELAGRLPNARVHVSVVRHTEARLEDGRPLHYWGLRTDLGGVVGFGLQPQPGNEDSAPAWRITFPSWCAALFNEGKIQLLQYVAGQSGSELVFRPVGEALPY